MQKWTLRIVFNDPTLNVDELFELDKSTTIYTKNHHNSIDWGV